MKQGPGIARWGGVLLYVSGIYLTIPYIPRLWYSAQALTGASLNSLAFYPLATIAALSLVAATYRTGADILSLLALAAIGCLYYYLYGHVFQEPIEKLHLFEYGLLSWTLCGRGVPTGTTSTGRPPASCCSMPQSERPTN